MLATRACRSLNCDMVKISFMYLGILVGWNHRNSLFWQNTIGKFRKKASQMKRISMVVESHS